LTEVDAAPLKQPKADDEGYHRGNGHDLVHQIFPAMSARGGMAMRGQIGEFELGGGHHTVFLSMPPTDRSSPNHSW